MSDLDSYLKAMRAGHVDTCIAIEQRHGLYGYPPEIVSAGLKAADEGRNVNAAVDAYIRGDKP